MSAELLRNVIDVTPTVVSVDDVVSAEDAAFLELKERQIRAVAASAVVEIGRHLIEARGRVGDGYFLAWLGEKFKQWSQRTAYNYMNLAERFPDLQALANVPVTNEALYLLAGPSVPQSVRDEAIEKAENGDRITKKDAEGLVRESVQKAVADYRASQHDAMERAIEQATRRLSGDNEALRREISRIKTAKDKPDMEDVCRTIEQSLGVEKLSPPQYRALAETMGRTIVVGKTSYDPEPREKIVQNEEHLRIASKITEALEVLAGAPPAASVVDATWPVQRKQHARVIGGVIEWLTAYQDLLSREQ